MLEPPCGGKSRRVDKSKARGHAGVYHTWVHVHAAHPRGGGVRGRSCTRRHWLHSVVRYSTGAARGRSSCATPSRRSSPPPPHLAHSGRGLRASEGLSCCCMCVRRGSADAEHAAVCASARTAHSRDESTRPLRDLTVGGCGLCVLPRLDALHLVQVLVPSR
eukprot:3058881-Prymnesium_polylepis.1